MEKLCAPWLAIWWQEECQRKRKPRKEADTTDKGKKKKTKDARCDESNLNQQERSNMWAKPAPLHAYRRIDRLRVQLLSTKEGRYCQIGLIY